MADEITLESFTGTLSPEHKTFFENHLKNSTEGAVTQYKTTLEEERKKQVPDKYELKLKDGSHLDPKVDVEKIASWAKERGLSQKDAQTYLESYNEIASELVKRSEQTFADMVNGWTQDIANDKDLGGANKEKTDASIKLVMDKFGSKDLSDFLNESQLGNHPEVVRLLVKIGNAMREDGFIAGGGGGGGRPKSLAERMYPNNKAS